MWQEENSKMNDAQRILVIFYIQISASKKEKIKQKIISLKILSCHQAFTKHKQPLANKSQKNKRQD